MVIDTTVQEKNVTYPTDTKLYRKIIVRCWKLADKEQIQLRPRTANQNKNKGRSSFFIKREPFGRRADLYSSGRSSTRAHPAMCSSLPTTGIHRIDVRRSSARDLPYRIEVINR